MTKAASLKRIKKLPKNNKIPSELSKNEKSEAKISNLDTNQC
jgi:hypothetical protein